MYKDIFALLQVYAEGIDFMEPMPDVVRDTNTCVIRVFIAGVCNKGLDSVLNQ